MQETTRMSHKFVKHYIFFRLWLQILRPSESAKERNSAASGPSPQKDDFGVTWVDAFAKLVLQVDKKKKLRLRM